MATFPSNRTRPAPPRARGSIEPTLLAPEPAVDPGHGGNVPEVTVSELSSALKRTVEDRFGFVRLRGEISNYRGPHSSGHAYFCLKDEGARIDAVVWKTALARMRVKPEEGMEVVATGKITTFPGKSSYQIVVESLEPAGLGALMALLEERRRKLAAEGLFDAARKRQLPFLPRVIGVVTSPTGAVIRDILHRVGARFPRHVLVWPVRVQGETSAAEVAAAIRGFNALLEDVSPHRPHLIIVARGGGSLEDLWGYNDEAVVRAVGESLIPLISAVGHETDWTLIDHAADLRAPTPTGAAEMALPVLAELFTSLIQLRGRQGSAAMRHLERAQAQLRAVSRLLPSGAELLAGPRQRLDRAGAQLPGGARQRLDRARLALAGLAHRLGAQSPQAQLARDGERLLGLSGRLGRAGVLGPDRLKERTATASLRLRSSFAGRLRMARLGLRHDREQLDAMSARVARAGMQGIDHRTRRLAAVAQMLAGLGYRSVLARGFALVRDADGTALRTVEALRRAGRVSIEVSDGTIPAATGDGEAVRPPQRRRARAESDQPQTSLFDL